MSAKKRSRRGAEAAEKSSDRASSLRAPRLCESPSFSERLARQIASTGDEVDVAFAEFLGRCPLPWDIESGTWVGAMPAIRRPPPPRRKGFTYQHLTHDDVLILLRVAERYAATIAASELPVDRSRRLPLEACLP